MAYGRIRFFNGETADHEPTTVVGMTNGIADRADAYQASVECCLLKTHTVTRLEVPAHLSHLATTCLEIQPPLDDRQIKKLGSKCLSDISQWADAITVIDNREVIPERHFQLAGPIINHV